MDITSADGACVAKAVAVVDRAVQHVGDGFYAAMRVHGEAADGAFEWIIESEMIEEQEWVVFVARARRDGAPQ